MAAIYRRKEKNSKGIKWRVVIRLKGHPTVCETFDRKQEAEDWANQTEHKIKSGQYNFHQHKHLNLFSQLVDRVILDGLLEHHKSKRDTLRHLEYWNDRLGKYALNRLSSEHLGKERMFLNETPISKGTKRSPATTNRYMATLSLALTYGVKSLKWISENPCLHIKKLKESFGRDRVLSNEEIKKLLSTCRESRSPYLYCIVLLGFSTGARLGEILNLEWRDIDFDNQIASLRETKNGRPRSIALSDEVILELKSIYQEKITGKTLVFASKTAFGKVDIKRSWQTALNRAEIQDFHFHDIRHCFATLAAGHGASNLELATAMGHRTLAMLQRYTHLDVEVTKKFSKRISQDIV